MRWYFLLHGISCLLITKMFLFWIFWRWKIWYFWAERLIEILYLLITEKFFVLIFSGRGNTVFFSQNVDGKIIFTEKFLFGSFREWEMRFFFLSQKVDGKMIFTDYWKVLVLNFLMMGNTVFFSVKKLMERWFLLVIEKFLFWTFWWWETRPFFQPKYWLKDDIYLVFLSFPWYSRTCEIWFFVQC